MLEAGYASADDIDTRMTPGGAHPIGPLRVAGPIGRDTLQAIPESLYQEYAELLHAVPRRCAG